MSNRKKKLGKLKRGERRLVFSCMVFSISWLRCRLLSNEHMIITTLSKNTEWMLRNSMKFNRNNTNKRKKKLMNNSSVFSKLKRNSTNSTVLLSKSRNTMR